MLSVARNLKNRKAPGPDLIPNSAVKTPLSVHPDAVAELYNTCLLEGNFPDWWKRQKLLLLSKPGKPAGEASSYRPIGKVFERVRATRLNAAMEDAGGLSSNQYGFRKGKSTLDAKRGSPTLLLKPELVPDGRVGRRNIV